MPLPENRSSNRKLSALRQIRAAIRHYLEGELECAITLAAAAEGQLPDTTDDYLLKGFKSIVPFEEFDYNLVINWLKHCNEPDQVTITSFEAAMTIRRSISKFVAVYWEISRMMDLFLKASDKMFSDPEAIATIDDDDTIELHHFNPASQRRD
jgi:hypothetical protein